MHIFTHACNVLAMYALRPISFRYDGIRGSGMASTFSGFGSVSISGKRFPTVPSRQTNRQSGPWDFDQTGALSQIVIKKIEEKTKKFYVKSDKFRIQQMFNKCNKRNSGSSISENVSSLHRTRQSERSLYTTHRLRP